MTVAGVTLLQIPVSLDNRPELTGRAARNNGGWLRCHAGSFTMSFIIIIVSNSRANYFYFNQYILSFTHTTDIQTHNIMQTNKQMQTEKTKSRHYIPSAGPISKSNCSCFDNIMIFLFHPMFPIEIKFSNMCQK